MAALSSGFVLSSHGRGAASPADTTGRVRATLVSLFEERGHHLGDPLVVHAALIGDSLSGEGVQVSGTLELPSGDRTPIPLADDGRAPDSLRGDGIYSGTGPILSMPGDHALFIRAMRSEPRFRATTANHFTVPRSRSRFDGRFQDRLVDKNDDGVVDHLRLRVGVTVTDSVEVTVTAYLSAGGKRALLGLANRTMSPGVQMLDVDAFLGPIARKGYEGTFVVDSLTLSENFGPRGLYLLDERLHAHVTERYTIAADTLRGPSWNGRVTAHGIDADGNGRFESLAVAIGVEGLPRAGRYYCSFGLARGARSITLGSEYLTLPRDSATVRLEFPGACIAGAPSTDKLVVRHFVLVPLLDSGRVARLPSTGIKPVSFPIEQDFPAEAFEPTGASTFRSRAGGTYECR